ncbi:MAG: hypothetical protein RSA41_06305 [Christensenella sp.]
MEGLDSSFRADLQSSKIVDKLLNVLLDSVIETISDNEKPGLQLLRACKHVSDGANLLSTRYCAHPDSARSIEPAAVIACQCEALDLMTEIEEKISTFCARYPAIDSEMLDVFKDNNEDKEME